MVSSRVVTTTVVSVVIAVALTAAGCGDKQAVKPTDTTVAPTYNNTTTTASSEQFFGRFPGPHVGRKLLVNEERGQVGAISLGMLPFEVKSALGSPTKSLTRGAWWEYCLGQVRSYQGAKYCTGPSLRVLFDGFIPIKKDHYPGKLTLLGVMEVDLWPSLQAGGLIQGGDLVTVRGIGPGSSVDEIPARYRVARVIQQCGAEQTGHPGSTYFIFAGRNTLQLDANLGRVNSVSIKRGHHPTC